MTPRSSSFRVVMDRSVKVISGVAALIGLTFLVWILSVVLIRGFSAFSVSFFTENTPPPGIEGGGLLNAIVGTFVMTFLASLIGIPIGILAGVFLAEFGRHSRFAVGVRFLNNVLMGTPSIVVGLLIYSILVRPFGGFSGWAGGVALAVLMLPLVTRTTEDMLNLVPDVMRESALALGVPRWRVTTQIVFRGARTGLLTGILLAIARVSGETAPLLFTALNSTYSVSDLAQPTANLTVTIYNFAMSPFPRWKELAWGGSLLITLSVLMLTVVARFLLKERTQ